MEKREREPTIKGIEEQKRRLTEILVSGDERRAALMCVIQPAVLLFAGFCKVWPFLGRVLGFFLLLFFAATAIRSLQVYFTAGGRMTACFFAFVLPQVLFQSLRPFALFSAVAGHKLLAAAFRLDQKTRSSP